MTVITREQMSIDLSEGLSHLFKNNVEVVLDGEDVIIAFNCAKERSFMLEYFGEQKQLFPAEGIDSWDKNGLFYLSHKLGEHQKLMLGEATVH